MNEIFWHIIDLCLTYDNKEIDKEKYLYAKKLYLAYVNNDNYKSYDNIPEETIDKFLKFPTKIECNVPFFNFLSLLRLSQCAHNQTLIDFFNKKDYSIDSLYEIYPKLLNELKEIYKKNAPFKYQELIDEHFLFFANLGSYFRPTEEELSLVLENYINLDEEKLKLLKFTEEEIKYRKIIIEQIKNDKEIIGNTFFHSCCNFISSIFSYRSKEDNNQKVKIL